MAAILSRRAMLSPPTTSVGGPIEFLYPTARAKYRISHDSEPGEVRRLGEAIDPEVILGFEGSSMFGAALARYPFAEGRVVREVPPRLSHREWRRTHRPGKTDPGDALSRDLNPLVWSGFQEAIWRHRTLAEPEISDLLRRGGQRRSDRECEISRRPGSGRADGVA